MTAFLIFLIAAQPCAIPVLVAHRGSSADRPENTLASYRRAIEAGAGIIEADPRLTLDNQFVSLHDARVDRTTNGSGDVSKTILTDVRRLDAGSKFSPEYRNERIPTLAEILNLARGKVRVLLDLKGDGQPYLDLLAAEIRRHNDARNVLAGVRSAQHIDYFQKNLPEVELIGLAPKLTDIASFLSRGVRTIRLWPDWMDNQEALQSIRAAKASLLLNADSGSPEEWRRIAPLRPTLVFTNNPARLAATFQAVPCP